MKRALAASFVIASVLAGCTFLVSFDELPSDDAGLIAPDPRPQADATVEEVGSPDTGPPRDDDAGAPDAAADADYSAACTGRPDGKYCNGNQIQIDAGDEDDLVTCLGEKTVSAKRCPNGCQRMPSGFPDECDECQGKATGLYCGDDFVGWHPLNKNTRIRCDNGAIVGNLICNTCSGTGPNATCP